MKILIVTDTLYPRGAETFVVRLANGMSSANNQVTVLNIHPYWSKQQLIDQLSPTVKLVNRPTGAARKIYQKVDGLNLRLGIDSGIQERGIINYIGNLIKKGQFDVVHSHLFKPDYYVACAKLKFHLPVRHVLTNHGDYLLFERNPPKRILNYNKKLNFVLGSIDHVVNISAQQTAHFESLRQKLSHQFSISNILNGYEGSVKKTITKSDLGFSDNTFVFGMVASGIREKGWDEAIEAFNDLNLPDTALVMVGEGHRLNELREQYQHNTKMFFAGYYPNPLDYIQLFDVGLLPSHYDAESLPTVLIEYLFLNKPVIVTDIGETAQMILTPTGQAAGILLPLESPAEIKRSLQDAMKKMVTDAELLARYRALTQDAFIKFDMRMCIDHYLAVYKQGQKN